VFGMSVRTDGLLSPRALAELSGWSTGAIRALINEKQIRYIKRGSRYLLPRDAIDEFIRRSMVEPAPEVGTADESCHGRTA